MIKSRGNNAHSFCKCGRLEKFEGIVPLRLLYDRSLPQSEVRYCFRKYQINSIMDPKISL